MTRLFPCCLVLLLVLTGCATYEPAPAEKKPPPKATVAETARSQIGTPYCNGGDNPRTGFDCSGLVQWCYSAHGCSLPRRTEDLLTVGVPVAKEDLQPGDLVFFNVSRKRWDLHVGIYSGKGRFIHSPTSGARVREEDLFARYWMRTYIGARRIFKNQ